MQNSQFMDRDWKAFVNENIDFREDEGVFRVGREIFTAPELFDLEMEFIFEKTWIYACHESEIAKANDFITVQIGRYPMIVTRDKENNLHALSNIFLLFKLYPHSFSILSGKSFSPLFKNLL